MWLALGALCFWDCHASALHLCSISSFNSFLYCWFCFFGKSWLTWRGVLCMSCEIFMHSSMGRDWVILLLNNNHWSMHFDIYEKGILSTVLCRSQRRKEGGFPAKVFALHFRSVTSLFPSPLGILVLSLRRPLLAQEVNFEFLRQKSSGAYWRSRDQRELWQE